MAWIDALEIALCILWPIAVAYISFYEHHRRVNTQFQKTKKPGKLKSDVKFDK